MQTWGLHFFKGLDVGFSKATLATFAKMARTFSLLYFQGPDSGDWDPGEYGQTPQPTAGEPCFKAGGRVAL